MSLITVDYNTVADKIASDKIASSYLIHTQETCEMKCCVFLVQSRSSLLGRGVAASSSFFQIDVKIL